MKPMPETMTEQVEFIASFIDNMRYDALTEFARQLHAMCAEDEDGTKYWDLDDPNEWAGMLHSWAEANAPSEES